MNYRHVVFFLVIFCQLATAGDKDILRDSCSTVAQPAKRLACYDAIERVALPSAKGVQKTKKKTSDEVAIDRAHEKIRAMLNDPDSARFSAEEVFKNTGAICGFVNAHNTTGGYGAPVRYIVTDDFTRIEGSDKWKFDYRWSELCSGE